MPLASTVVKLKLMALATIASRFHTTKPCFFLASILKSPAPQHVLSSSLYSYLTPSLVRAFHQTPTVSSPTIHESLRSALRPSDHHNIYPTIILNKLIDKSHEGSRSEVSKLLELLDNSEGFSSEGEAIDFLDGFGVEPNEGLINSLIWALREKWKLAFWVFKWGEKWGCNGDQNRSLTIWVLGNHKKFNTAWCLVRDIYQLSMDTKQAMIVMIDRYAAANDPTEAIRTFQIMDKFKLSPDQKAFYTFLDILCQHGNVEEAEEFMFLNKKLFQLDIEGFNIILNGWCEITVDVFEAKRVWREMARCCIIPNATSYTLMISCFSKVGNLFDSLRLYDEMNKKGWLPCRKVYNSLIYVLAGENCLKEALRIVDKMKERGLTPDSTSYNSMICPLCETGKLEDAKTVLATMIEENVGPTINTYHAFLRGGSLEGTMEILDLMVKAGVGLNGDTFSIILSTLLELGQSENALQIWVDMKGYKVIPDSAHYTVMVGGLIRCGLLVKAREIYAEMVSNGNMDDPKLKKLLEEPARDGSHQNGKQRKRFVKGFKKGARVYPKCSLLKVKHDRQSRTNTKSSGNENIKPE